MPQEPSNTRNGENLPQEESRLFLQIFLHLEDCTSPFTCIYNEGDSTSNDGPEAIPPNPCPPQVYLPVRRPRRHRGLMESSRLASEDQVEIVSTEENAEFKRLFSGPFYYHPHGRSTVSKTSMRTKRRVSLLQFDLTSSQETIASYLKNIRDLSHWFFVDLRFEDDCLLSQLSFLLVISHFLCHLDLLSSFWCLVVFLKGETNDSGNEDPLSLPIEWHLSLRVISGIIPAIVLISGCTLFVALVCQWNVIESLLLMCLVALFLVECLVPLTLLASMALYVCGSISGPNAMAISLSVWFVSLTMSRVLRRVIYPRLVME